MAEEIKNTNVDVQQNVETQNTQTNPEPEKTFTLSEVQALLNAKNHEKEARKQAEAELKTLKEENAKLKGEDSVTKFKEDQYNNLKAQLEALQKEKDELVQKNLDNDLKDQLRLFKGVVPEAIDDILEKAKKDGFKKTEVGYIDNNGKTLNDFFERLKTSHSYYFGSAQNKNVLSDALKESIEKAKKSGSTLSIIQEGFKNFKPTI